MEHKHLIDNIKNDIQDIDCYINSYENIHLPSGRIYVVKIDTLQSKLLSLEKDCVTLHSLYPEICTLKMCSELKGIIDEDIPNERYKIKDYESEFEICSSIWHSIKKLLSSIINYKF